MSRCSIICSPSQNQFLILCPASSTSIKLVVVKVTGYLLHSACFFDFETIENNKAKQFLSCSTQKLRKLPFPIQFLKPCFFSTTEEHSCDNLTIWWRVPDDEELLCETLSTSSFKPQTLSDELSGLPKPKDFEEHTWLLSSEDESYCFAKGNR